MRIIHFWSISADGQRKRTRTERYFRVARLAATMTVKRRLLITSNAEKELPDALTYVGIILDLNPGSSQDRLNRALLNLQVGNTELAKPDLQWILDNEPEGIHLGRIRDLFDRL